MNQSGKILKIFACLLLSVCLVTGSHISEVKTHQFTAHFSGCDDGRAEGPIVDNIWPKTFNSTHVHSIEMCSIVPGQHERCGSVNGYDILLSDSMLDGSHHHSNDNQRYQRVSKIPNGVTTEYCFISYACQWRDRDRQPVNNFALTERPGGYQLEISFSRMDLSSPFGTPIEYVIRAASFRIRTTEDIDLIDGHRHFDFDCDLEDCELTADTSNGGSGTFQDRKIVKASVDPARAPTCIAGDRRTLGQDETYLIIFSCDEVCPLKLKVTGTTKV